MTRTISFFFGSGELTSFADNTCHLINTFANCYVIETSDGLILFDIGQELFGPIILEKLRRITEKPIKYIIYSHGHFDHCFGFQPIINEIEKKGLKKPQIIAHENLIRRFQKYERLANYHKWLNKQQFASVIGDDYEGPSAQNTLYPTIIVTNNEYTFTLGKDTFHLYHGWGETDDALWLWFPAKKVILTGDFILSSYPNVGNPFKVQRYPKQWAETLELMLKKKPHFLGPGHGNLITGKDVIREVLEGTAQTLHFVHDEVVKRLNEGKWFEQIYHEMLKIYPEAWKTKDYLQPLYGCYPFAIHAVYRLYHGWYDSGNPTTLFPAKKAEIAQEFLKIAEPQDFIRHSRRLYEAGELQLALHIIDPVIEGLTDPSPQLTEAKMLKQEILEKKAEETSSFIAANIYQNGIQQLRED